MTRLHTEFGGSEEARAFASIRLQALATDPASYLDSFSVEVDRSEEDWVDHLAKPNRTAVFGYTDISPADLVGILLVDTYQASANLHGLYVSPSYRRNGFATELIRSATLLVQEQGIQRVTAQTLYGNQPAQKLFEACGFSTGGGKVVNRARHGKQFGEYQHERLLATK